MNSRLDRESFAPVHRLRGYSLIELMVGLVLGMIAVIVVMQVFSMSERSKRTTTGGDDAVTNGVIALSQLQRDVRQSGQGFSNMSLAGCSLQLPGGWTITGLGPVTINHAAIPAGDSNSDTLLIVSAGSAGSPEGDRINAQPNVSSYSVATPSAFVIQDFVVAASQAQAVPCALLLDRVSTKVGSVVTVSTGGAGTQNTLFNWGTTPRIMAYAIRSGHLTECDFLVNDCRAATPEFWLPIADGAVSLRAQYGRDTSAPMDANVDVFDTTTPTTSCGWMRTSAVRFALTTRSGQLEKTEVTAAAPTWGAGTGTAIVLSSTSLWKQYRYRVLEAVVPLRNMAWQGIQPSC